MQYLPRQVESQDSIILLCMMFFLLLVVAKLFYPRRFQEFIALAVNDKYFLVQGRDDNLWHPFNILLFLAQWISVSLFLYLIVSKWAPERVATSPYVLLQIATAYAVFVMVKALLEKIIGDVFSISNIINRYLYQKLTLRSLIAIFLFIGNLIFYFIWSPTVTGIVLFSATTLVLLGISLFYSYKGNSNMISNNLFYFILYLCALEISPYLILYKVVI
ncbi:DUF4271 domain-containing protein [Luteirhabdus pelagi]|uniref:DUF4271 domain-containing protein n=1 Tax=Luteirhabdus pelagi TaxID=2792783 RepID=UPI00193A2F1C|nr:DUF4271 domain-containing protein [Luteirhabdus pelagi]